MLTSTAIKEVVKQFRCVSAGVGATTIHDTRTRKRVRLTAMWEGSPLTRSLQPETNDSAAQSLSSSDFEANSTKKQQKESDFNFPRESTA